MTIVKFVGGNGYVVSSFCICSNVLFFVSGNRKAKKKLSAIITAKKPKINVPPVLIKTGNIQDNKADHTQ